MNVRPPTYLHRLSARADEAPDLPAVIETTGRQVTRRELWEQVRTVAAGLRVAGMKPGDHALFSVRPGIDALVLLLAIHEAGGVIVPIDPSMSGELFRARLAWLSPSWIFAESVLLASSSRWLSWLLRRRGMTFVPLGRVNGVRYVRTGPWLPGLPASLALRDLKVPGATAVQGGPALDGEADAFIVFTSGTTGTPKGVVHTQASLDATLDSVGRELRITAGDVLYSRELHLILPALFEGARVIIARRTSFSAEHTFGDFVRFGITHAFAVTRDAQALADHCSAAGRQLPGTLRMLLIGGAPVPVAFLKRLRERITPATDVWCIYGMTELLPIASISMQAKLAAPAEGDFVGPTVRGVEARIANDGELLVRGPGLFSRYLGHQTVDEHPTGDLARMDASGITLLGRAKDMIIRGEYNIYPALYEPAFDRLPGVRRSAMIGIPDDAGADEQIIVVLEPASGVEPRELERTVEEALRRGRLDIDGFARPDHVIALDLPEVGRSSKVDKAALRRVVRERLG